MPTLLSFRDHGRCAARRGRAARCRRAFRSTSSSTSTSRSSRRSQPRWVARSAGGRSSRSATSPAANCRTAVRMVALLPSHLLARDYQWIVFTATSAVREILLGFGAPLIELARAERARVALGSDQWGRYYETDPRVFAGLPSRQPATPRLRHGRRMTTSALHDALRHGSRSASPSTTGGDGSDFRRARPAARRGGRVARRGRRALRAARRQRDRLGASPTSHCTSGNCPRCRCRGTSRRSRSSTRSTMPASTACSPTTPTHAATCSPDGEQWRSPRRTGLTMFRRQLDPAARPRLAAWHGQGDLHLGQHRAPKGRVPRRRGPRGGRAVPCRRDGGARRRASPLPAAARDAARERRGRVRAVARGRAHVLPSAAVTGMSYAGPDCRAAARAASRRARPTA